MNIKTVYYDHVHAQLKTTRSIYANEATARCSLYMATNQYGADSAEVYDIETGELHAVLKRFKSNEVRITYMRDPMNFKQPMRRAASSIFDKV